MYLKKSYRKKTGRIYLVIAQKYRHPVTQVSTDRTVKSLGYLDELEKEYNDPIAHFREVAERMTEEENEKNHITLKIDKNEKLEEDTDNKKNFGYAAISKIYHELELHRFLNNKSRHENFEYNANSIMLLLVISRLIAPGSKKKAFDNKHRYFERFDFELHDIYNALTYYARISKELGRFLHEKITEKYGRDTTVIYYDVTNYYFEIDRQDKLRRKGIPKQGRKKPLVQMGLALDADGIPIHYEIFPGNKLDKETFRAVIGEVRRNYDTGRIIVVADKGIITGDNIYYLKGGDRNHNLNGYVFSFSIRGGTEEFKEYVIDSKGYVDKKGKPFNEEQQVDFKIKSRVTAREINVTMRSGRIQKKIVYEKQVVFWSEKYRDKARADREDVLKKAQDMVADPKKYKKATSYGAAAYVKNLEFDKETGEIKENGNKPVFDFEKLEEEEKYDGYYAIVTSELEMPDSQIIDTYRGLWEIEETFKITKSELETRPMWVRIEDHIEAHFLTCFIALVIVRLLQKRLNREYSTAAIIDCLKEITCTLEDDNLYLFGYRTKLSDALGENLGIDFTSKRMTQGEIKKVLAKTKK